MRKVLLFISNVFLVVLLSFVALLSIATFVIVLVGKSIPNFDFVFLVYLLYGFIFAPMEYLISGTVGQMNRDAVCTIGFIVTPIIALLSILLITYKLRSQKKEEYRIKFYKISSYILTLSFLTYFIVNLSLLIINLNQITDNLTNSVFEIKGIEVGGVVTIIYLCIIIYAIFSLLFSLLATIFYKEKVVKGVKVYGTINFYSKEFEEHQAEIQIKKQEEKIKEEPSGIKESREEAKDLVLKIMQLEELRASGQISDVEYTKLRQKAIKRYKR